MIKTVVKIEDLSKKYIIRHNARETRFLTLRDTLSNKAKSLFSGNEKKVTREEFLALNNINLEIKEGERVGLIGRNGAGKSTLLKIISKIVEPTTGSIGLNGKVASLLEVGTGFHQELTGRENIYLNGAILGMQKRDIDKNFDEIVSFAEIEKFLDTPVKRYSSGMYVRLAFAIAAHLEPEIMIVDEVLAVGDAAFQKKCLGKMEEVSKKSGRTIIFVSHNMAAIRNLCERGILLRSGEIIEDGGIEETVDKYLSLNANEQSVDLSSPDVKRSGTGKVRFSKYSLKNDKGETTGSLKSGSTGYIHIELESAGDLSDKNVVIDADIEDLYGTKISKLSNRLTGEQLIVNDKLSLDICIPKIQLTHGRYSVQLYLHMLNEVADQVKSPCYLDIEMGDYYGTGRILEGGAHFYMEHKFSCKS